MRNGNLWRSIVEAPRKIFIGPLGRVGFVVCGILLGIANRLLDMHLNSTVHFSAHTHAGLNISIFLLSICLLTPVAGARLLDLGLSRWLAAVLWLPPLTVVATRVVATRFDFWDQRFIFAAILVSLLPVALLQAVLVFCPSSLFRNAREHQDSSTDGQSGSAHEFTG